jgi:hypothetical protein
VTQHFRQVRRSTVIQNAAGQTFSLGGYQADRKQAKSDLFQDDRAKNPPQIDLRPHMSPVENQSSTSSCAANAMAGAYEYLLKRLKNSNEDVSRLFIYYNARELDGDTSQDQGTYLSSCTKVAKKLGVCLETTWPFDPQQILEQPHEDAYTEAKGFPLNPVARPVQVDLQTMKNCLASGFPFIFGLQLFSSFEKAGPEGLVPMPDVEQDNHDGGHAMLCVGYSDPDRVFIVRNSWGEDWGDGGYCYIPYDYMTNPELNSDCWALVRRSDVSPKTAQKTKDLSKDIKPKSINAKGSNAKAQQGEGSSLFNKKKAQVARAIQTPGAYQEVMVGEEYQSYEVVYLEQLVYTVEEGFVTIEDYVEQYGDLESLYSEESFEAYFESSEEEEDDEFEDDETDYEYESDEDEDLESEDDESEEEEGDDDESEEEDDEEDDDESEDEEESEDDESEEGDEEEESDDDDESEDDESEEEEEGEDEEDDDEEESDEPEEEESEDESYESEEESDEE